MLYEHYLEDFYLLEKTEQQNSVGGTDETYQRGKRFQGALVMRSSVSETGAESERLSDTYGLTVRQTTTLNFYDIIEQAEDGTTYRVISSKKETPATFTPLNLRTYEVERWDVE